MAIKGLTPEREERDNPLPDVITHISRNIASELDRRIKTLVEEIELDPSTVYLQKLVEDTRDLYNKNWIYRLKDLETKETVSEFTIKIKYNSPRYN